MPRLDLPRHSDGPAPAALVAWHVPPVEDRFAEVAEVAEVAKLAELGTLALHFPARDLSGMPPSRILEHTAVAHAVQALLGTDEWHVTHGVDGKPALHHAGPPFELSLSHHSGTFGTVAVAAAWQGGRGGVDLVDLDDPRLARVASRFMSADEQLKWAGSEGWVWAAKEAMFKGHGPNLDFRTHLQVDTLEAHTADHPTPSNRTGSVGGTVRGQPWAGHSARIDLGNTRLGVVWGP